MTASFAAGFTKLFSTLVTSTIWREDDKTRILWITMLALSDRCGVVGASVPGLAHIAGMSSGDCHAALAKLAAPDKNSRTKTNEGRRIEGVDGGWKILNYLKYRNLGRSLDRAEYLRLKKRESRARLKLTEVDPGQRPVDIPREMSTDVNHDQPIAEADTDKKNGRKNALKKPGPRFAKLAADTARFNDVNPTPPA